MPNDAEFDVRKQYNDVESDDMTQKPHWIEKSVGWGLITYRTKILIIKENLRMQNYDGSIKTKWTGIFLQSKG